jgi:hypothetical protein
MFEALSWRKPPFTEVAIRHAADSLAHAKSPIVLGSLAAMALIGMATRIGMNRAWFDRAWINRTWSALNGYGFRQPRATMTAARARASSNEKTMPASQSGRRRRKRKRKAATH